MKHIILGTQCPDCNKQIVIDAPIDLSDIQIDNCAKIKASAYIIGFVISSDMIQDYLSEKLKLINPEGKIVIQPYYTEPKLKKWEKHRGYAILKASISANMIKHEKGGIPEWILRQGYSGDIQLIESVANQIIRPYRLSRSDFDKDYKNAERRTLQYGITEVYAEAVRNFLDMKVIPAEKNTDAQVVVGLSAQSIIRDMLSDRASKKLEGEIQFDDIIQINQDLIRWVVYIRDGFTRSDVDPNVLQMLTGLTIKKK